MATAVTMPRLGLSMVEGTVTEWRVRPGDAVTKGQILLIVESEKAEVEIEAFASGVLGTVYVEAGTTVPIGALLGAITDPGEAFDPEGFKSSFVPELEGAPATAVQKSASPTLAQGALAARVEGVGLKAAPAARSLAKRLAIDLATVAGSGPGGRILPEDVERAAGSRVAVDGAHLAVEVRGEGPSLLFVCGYGVDASGWRRQVDGLAGDHTVITYDHRGIGRSSPIGEAGVTIAGLAEDAAALLARLGKAPACVVGASMGAAVALELARAHPDTVRALVLITPLFLADPRFEAVIRAWSETESPSSESRVRGMLPWLLGREFLSHSGKREAAAVALRAMAERTPPATLRFHAAALLGWLGTRENDLAGVSAPALVVAGADDVLTPREQAEALARALPKARVEVIGQAGHAVMIERADELNALIREFVGNAR